MHSTYLKIFVSILLFLSLGNIVHAQAKAAIELKTEARKEIIVASDGKDLPKWVALEKVVPGDTVVYIISASNVSNDPAESVMIEDRIPEHLVYLSGSAEGSQTTITYSVDGETFAQAGKLKIKLDNGETRLAQADDFTHVRWTLNSPLQPGKTRQVSFRAKVE